ncbi:uncharacterized protein LOC142345042 [Convolutriloba macropyga]|uniref:uncharacterized protein LOC142345042 n=1 Tax=Convolutriloba macropyga TaxID=536237 RepID=UPI003F51EFCA
MGQFKSLEKGFEKDLELNDRYEETIKTDHAKGFVRELALVEIESTAKCPQWYLPHHPAAKPHKPKKVRRVCNAAAKYTGISLNDKLMPGPDLLNSLLGIKFRFRESFIAMTMDIEFKFLQVAVAKDECKFIKFHRQPNPTQTVDVYEYKRHVFGARSSPTCVKYALRKAAEDSKNHYPKAQIAQIGQYNQKLSSLEKTKQKKPLCRQSRIRTVAAYSTGHDTANSIS